MGGGSGDDDGDLEGRRGGQLGEGIKMSDCLWGREGVHMEYRMPEFPDFGPQSLARQHSSS